eukprot:6574390-Pyramimonas_sp.AAC.1
MRREHCRRRAAGRAINAAASVIIIAEVSFLRGQWPCRARPKAGRPEMRGMQVIAEISFLRGQ